MLVSVLLRKYRNKHPQALWALWDTEETTNKNSLSSSLTGQWTSTGNYQIHIHEMNVNAVQFFSSFLQDSYTVNCKDLYWIRRQFVALNSTDHTTDGRLEDTSTGRICTTTSKNTRNAQIPTLDIQHTGFKEIYTLKVLNNSATEQMIPYGQWSQEDAEHQLWTF